MQPKELTTTRYISVLLCLLGVADCGATDATYSDSEDAIADDTFTPIGEDAISLGNYLSTEPGGTASLLRGQYLVSPRGKYRLYMQNDDNLVIYQLPSYKPIWHSGTWNTGVDGLYLNADGNLQLRETGTYPEQDPNCANGVRLTDTERCQGTWDEQEVNVRWETHTRVMRQKARLYMQDDGNLVLYNIATWHAAWASGSWQPN